MGDEDMDLFSLDECSCGDGEALVAGAQMSAGLVVVGDVGMPAALDSGGGREVAGGAGGAEGDEGEEEEGSREEEVRTEPCAPSECGEGGGEEDEREGEPGEGEAGEEGAGEDRAQEGDKGAWGVAGVGLWVGDGHEGETGPRGGGHRGS